MKKSRSLKFIQTISIVLIVFLLICWDFANTNSLTVYKSTFKNESEFTHVSEPTKAVKVAIVPSDFTGLTNPVSRDKKPTYDQIEGMVRKAVELQGGFDGIINKGNSVMIKVNLVGGNSPSGQGENTDVNVVKALIKTICDYQNDVEIIVAEATARNNDDPNEGGSVWHNSGYVSLLTDPYLSGIRLSLLNMNQTISDLVEVDLGSSGMASTQNYKYHVHKKEIEADVYISVPVLKIHGPVITAGLKNQIGTAPGCYYGYNKEKGKEKDGTKTPGILHAKISGQDWSEEEIVDLSTIAGIDFVLIDAIMCLETSKGYNGSNQLRMNTIIAGIDPVAVDNVCTRLLGLNPDDIVHIFYAEKVGLGTNNPDKIEVVGASISTTMKRAKKGTIYGSTNRTWLLSPAFNGSKITEEYIADEKNYIPKAGQEGWSEPIFFLDDQIDLFSYYDAKSSIVTYAFSKFYSPTDTEAELWLGRQEPMYVYINHELVYSKTTNEDFTGRKEAIVNIKKGENTLLVKTLNNFGIYSFALNICEVEPNKVLAGNRIPGLKFYTDSLNYTAPVDTSGITDTVTTSDRHLHLMNTNHIALTNYPNPFSNFTTIKFSIPDSDITSIRIYNMQGQLIKELTTNFYTAGEHEITFETNQLKSGQYICKMKSGKYSKSIKLIHK